MSPTGAEVRVYRSTQADQFLIVSNALARNRLPGVQLTAVARCVLLHLLSLPPGWKTNRDRLARDFVEGRDRIGKAINELIDAGLLLRQRANDPGTGLVVWTWQVTDTPGTFAPVNAIDRDSVDGVDQGKVTNQGEPGEPETRRSEPSTEMPSTVNQALDSQFMATSIDEDGGNSLPLTPSPAAEAVAGSATEGRTEGEFLPELPEPSTEALTLVAGLEFGRYRRPNQRQARFMAQLFDLGNRDKGLTLREVRQHAQAAINEARASAISYLTKAPRGALLPGNLPVPAVRGTPAPATRPEVDDAPAPSSEATRSRLVKDWKSLGASAIPEAPQWVQHRAAR